MKKVQIIGMYKNNIIYKNYKNKLKQKTLVSSVVFCLLIFSTCYFKLVGGVGANAWYDSVQSVYSPTTQLYSDEGNVVFTNNESVLSHSGSFDLPMIDGEIKIEDGKIVVVPNANIIISTPCPGVVEQVGISNDGKKYIKIKHTTKIYSVVENVDMVCVNEKDIVKRGDKIATANSDKIITISIYKNKKLIENLKIENNKIVWE